MWKEHFKNLLANPSKVKNKPIIKIFNSRLDIRLGQFIQEELNEVLSKIKNKKAAGLDEILQEICKTREFNDLLFQFCNVVYKKNTIERWTKDSNYPFP